MDSVKINHKIEKLLANSNNAQCDKCIQDVKVFLGQCLQFSGGDPIRTGLCWAKANEELSKCHSGPCSGSEK